MSETTAKRKPYHKLILDLVLIVLVALLYRKQAISLHFHEVAGLVLFGLFAIHMLFNRKWIAGVTRRLTDEKLPVKTRIGWAVDALLAVSWTLTIVSGVLMSKTLGLSLSVPGPWQVVHYTSAAFGLALVGIHVGLHLSYLRGMLHPVLSHLGRAAKPVSALCAAILVIGGSYSVATTGYLRWLTMPFSANAQGVHGDFAARSRPEGDAPAGQPPQGDAPYGQRHGGKGGARGDFVPAGDGNGARSGAGQGAGSGTGAHSAGQGSTGALSTILSFGSIAGLFAVLTGGVEQLVRWRKKEVPALLSPDSTDPL